MPRKAISNAISGGRTGVYLSRYVPGVSAVRLAPVEVAFGCVGSASRNTSSRRNCNASRRSAGLPGKGVILPSLMRRYSVCRLMLSRFVVSVTERISGMASSVSIVSIIPRVSDTPTVSQVTYIVTYGTIVYIGISGVFGTGVCSNAG